MALAALLFGEAEAIAAQLEGARPAAPALFGFEPANMCLIRLEAVRSNRRGQFSIRINTQRRICFVWPAGAPGPVLVEIVDYH